MTSEHPTIPPEIVACIFEGRAPTVHELGRTADRIERDLSGAKATFAWGRSTDAPARLTSVRIALAALAGTDEPTAPAVSP